MLGLTCRTGCVCELDKEETLARKLLKSGAVASSCYLAKCDCPLCVIRRSFYCFMQDLIGCIKIKSDVEGYLMVFRQVIAKLMGAICEVWLRVQTTSFKFFSFTISCIIMCHICDYRPRPNVLHLCLIPSCLLYVLVMSRLPSFATTPTCTFSTFLSDFLCRLLTNLLRIELSVH